MTNPLNQILEPFGGIDIAGTYSRYSPFIDFVIYLVIFTGLSQFVFAKRFPGKGGTSISIGIALVLSCGLSLFSAATGFKLANFGPIAAGVVVLLVGLLIYGFLKHLAGNSVNAGIASFVVTYFLMRSVTPELYAWAQQNQFAAWLDAALLLAIPILIVILIRRAKSLFGSTGVKLWDQATPQPDSSVEAKKSAKEVGSRESLEKNSYKEEKRIVKKTENIDRDLSVIIEILKTKDLSPEKRTAVNKALIDLRRQDNELVRILNRLRLMSRKLENWQINGFRKLQATYKDLPPEKQKALREAIQAEQATIMKHRTIDNIEKQTNRVRQQYMKQLNLAVNELNHRNRRGAVYFLLQARESERESKDLLKRLQSMQKDMLRLTKAEVGLVKSLAA